MRRLALRLLVLVLALVGLSAANPVSAQDTVVHAVLFYSPTCPHCHDVIDDDLPPLIEQYGDQLQIVGINTTHPDGQALYQAALEAFDVPQERAGVPALYIGDRHLVGSVEIPEQLPGLIDMHLAAGGVGWPAIPGLAALRAAAPEEEPAAAAEEATTVAPAGTDISAPTSTTAVAVAAGDPPAASSDLAGVAADLEAGTVASRFRRDLTGNSLSVLVLLGMLAVVVASFRRSPATSTPAAPAGWRHWAILALVIAGLFISAYMTFVETTGAEAVCGPVGDCNTVQQSSYAMLFGLIPIGVLGLAGYAALGIAWLAAHIGRLAYTPLMLLAVAGTLFSIYLTVLEPFVIGATCLWCLSSAIAITLILLFAMPRRQPSDFSKRQPESDVSPASA
ncbi:MAG TPA: vitamin K epoxide reductase family protein, partial [Hyphomicrobiales bacterium]|nr:vitamin K epoxide reductase family protein [Hyphomicrobiales bacterium]